MVGGTVVDVAVVDEKRLYVDCVSWRYADHCAIHIENTPESRKIEFGDQIWWQSGKAYWTPVDESKVDVPFKKLGPSGQLRSPAVKALEEQDGASK